MRTAREIYQAYRIMPSLQLHQLRVAAVAKQICDNFDDPIDTNDIVLACLFHDMANIIKFDLELFPEFRAEKGSEYWESVKREYIEKYGKEQHGASARIAREIGLPEHVVSYIEGIAFSKLEQTRDIHSFGQKIAEYGDLRVGPHGVLSMQERIDEAHERYATHRTEMGRSEEDFHSLVSAAYEIERQVFAHCTIAPEDINDVSVAPIIEELWDYPVS